MVHSRELTTQGSTLKIRQSNTQNFLESPYPLTTGGHQQKLSISECRKAEYPKHPTFLGTAIGF